MPTLGLLCRTEDLAAALLSLRGPGGPYKNRTAAVWVMEALFADVLPSSWALIGFGGKEGTATAQSIVERLWSEILGRPLFSLNCFVNI